MILTAEFAPDSYRRSYLDSMKTDEVLFKQNLESAKDRSDDGLTQGHKREKEPEGF